MKTFLTCKVRLGSNRAEAWIKTQAPCNQGANRLLQAALAQPVSDWHQWTSLGTRSNQYLVHRNSTFNKTKPVQQSLTSY